MEVGSWLASLSMGARLGDALLQMARLMLDTWGHVVNSPFSTCPRGWAVCRPVTHEPEGCDQQGVLMVSAFCCVLLCCRLLVS